MQPASDPRLVMQLAAGLRAQADDLSLYAGMLLDLVTTALPADLVEVERGRRSFEGFRRGDAPVTAVSVTLGDWAFRLERGAVGAAPVATLGHVVHGIVLSRERLPLVPWSERLAGQLAEYAARDTGAAAALERLVRPLDPDDL